MLEERNKAFDYESFIRLTPKRLAEGISMGFLPLLESQWNEPLYEKSESEGVSLALDLWDSAGLALLDALDTRDPMFVYVVLTLIGPVVQRVGRAASLIRRSPKFAPFCTFVIRSRGMDNLLNTMPVQRACFRTIGCLMYKLNKSFFDALVYSGTLHAVVDAFHGCCPSVLASIALVLERFVDTALENSDGTLDPSLRTLFERVARIANTRVLETEMSQERVRTKYKVECYADISEVVGPLAALLQTLAYTLKIPVPTRTLQHMKPFGDGYTAREPTDPLERARWIDRYVTMRVTELDWASPAAKAPGQELTKAKKMKYIKLENQIKSNLQCAACHTLEDFDAEQLLSKCSRCKRVYYCTRSCQTVHWPLHKKTCKNAPRSSLPEKLLTMEESIDKGYAQATADGNVVYPCQLVVWLDWKYNSELKLTAVDNPG
jgi:hypothetical protein